MTVLTAPHIDCSKSALTCSGSAMGKIRKLVWCILNRFLCIYKVRIKTLLTLKHVVCQSLQYLKEVGVCCHGLVGE
jgi:hypothetical protein